MASFVDQVTNEPHDTVTAPDGSAELLIPQGALPPGTSASQLSITPLDPAQAGITWTGEPPIAAWKLSPDGLHFSTPVLFEVLHGVAGADTDTMLALLSGTTLEGAPTLLQGDAQGDQTAVAAQISHFTVISWVPLSFAIGLGHVADQFVGEPFTVTANVQVHILKRASGVVDTGAMPAIKDAMARGTWEASGPIDPDLLAIGYFDGVDQPVQESQQFTCNTSGSAQVKFVVTAKFQMIDIAEVAGQPGEVAISGEVEKTGSSNTFQCRQPPSPPVNSPSAPPSLAVPPVFFDMALQVSAPGASGGDAYFEADGDSTQVTLDVKAQPALTGPASIRSGTCDSPGPVVYDLSPNVSTQPQGKLPAGLASLLTGQNIVTVAGNDGTGVVACAALPRAP